MGLLYKLNQSVNLHGISLFFKVLFDRELIVPHLHVNTINDIDFNESKERGIEAWVFDGNNTLILPPFDKRSEKELYKEIIPGLERAKEVYGTDNLAVISNSAGIPTDERQGYRKANALEELSGLNVIRHKRKKPACVDEILAHFGLDYPSKIGLVGDRVLVDVAFGKSAGFYTVLVNPFANKGDPWIVNRIRPLERKMLKKAVGKYGNPVHDLNATKNYQEEKRIKEKKTRTFGWLGGVLTAASLLINSYLQDVPLFHMNQLRDIEEVQQYELAQEEFRQRCIGLWNLENLINITDPGKDLILLNNRVTEYANIILLRSKMEDLLKNKDVKDFADFEKAYEDGVELSKNLFWAYVAIAIGAVSVIDSRLSRKQALEKQLVF